MGCVFNVQRFSVNDGPGIRTTVFLKGCPLKCRWCHNPESGRARPELLYDPAKCLLCGGCVTACPADCHTVTASAHEFDRARCRACGKCAAVCPAACLEVAGSERSVEEVMDEVLRDEVFYRQSGGGVTLSGGEPLAQFAFTRDLLLAAKAHHLHTCVETCGFATEEQLRELLPLVDIFLYDYKETGRERHRAYTGVYNDTILHNLRMLDGEGATIILRCPIIPTLNDRAEHFDGIARVAEELRHVSEIHIEPYHPLGVGKAVRLGEEMTAYASPDEKTVEEWISAVAAKTTVPVRRA